MSYRALLFSLWLIVVCQPSFLAAEYVPLHERVTTEDCRNLSSDILRLTIEQIEPIIDSMTAQMGLRPPSLNRELLSLMNELRESIKLCSVLQHHLEKQGRYAGINFRSVLIDFSAVRSTLGKIYNDQLNSEELLKRYLEYLKDTQSRLIRTLSGGDGLPDSRRSPS